MNESQISFERVCKNESLSIFELQQSNYSCSLKLIKMMKTTLSASGTSELKWFFLKKKSKKEISEIRLLLTSQKIALSVWTKENYFCLDYFFFILQNDPILTHHAIIIREKLFFKLNQSEPNYFCRTLNLIDEDMACKWFVLNVFK